jgi:chemotaxis protein CheX
MRKEIQEGCMKAEYVNPFLQAFDNVVGQVVNVKAERGNLFVKEGSVKTGDVFISIGVTGDLTGSVVLNMSECAAKYIASKMMFGMEVKELDDMAKSAISELGNMIAGNSAGFFMNIGKNINITPPSLYTGSNMSMYAYKGKALCVPMKIGDHIVEIDISLY